MAHPQNGSNKMQVTQQARQQQHVVKRVETNPLLMLSEQWTRLEALSERAFRSGILPKYVDCKEKAFIIALKGVELGLSPMYAMEHVVVVNGKATIDGQAMLRLIYERVPGARVDFVTPVERQNDECEVEMARPGQKPQKFRFAMDDARRAGLLSKPGPWQQYPRQMLKWRAVSEGARTVFPDAIAGLYLPEEMGAKSVSEQGEIIEAEFSPAPPIQQESPKAQEVGAASTTPSATESPAPTPEAPSANTNGARMPTQKQLAYLHVVKNKSGWGDDALKSLMRAKFGKESTKDLTWTEWEDVKQEMERNPLVENQVSSAGEAQA